MCEKPGDSQYKYESVQKVHFTKVWPGRESKGIIIILESKTLGLFCFDIQTGFWALNPSRSVSTDGAA